MGEGSLQTLDFGPSRIKILPDHIINKYVMDRYGSGSSYEYCNFPFDKTPSKRIPGRDLTPPRASQLNAILKNWYIPLKKRKEWVDRIRVDRIPWYLPIPFFYPPIPKVNGDSLSREVIPNLNNVEVG
jgi:hypothetical protein